MVFTGNLYVYVIGWANQRESSSLFRKGASDLDRALSLVPLSLVKIPRALMRNGVRRSSVQAPAFISFTSISTYFLSETQGANVRTSLESKIYQLIEKLITEENIILCLKFEQTVSLKISYFTVKLRRAFVWNFRQSMQRKFLRQ